MRTILIATVALAAIAGTAADDVVKTISHGDTVDLQKEFAAGKFTVVEFYADW